MNPQFDLQTRFAASGSALIVVDLWSLYCQRELTKYVPRWLPPWERDRWRAYFANQLLRLGEN